ncbi:MAG: hypothetical protein ACRDUW_23280 [Pseudonocardiaceae bacterium]
MQRYVIFDSATGDELGTIEFDEDEKSDSIIETLQGTGYLDKNGQFLLDDAYFTPFSEDESDYVIVDVHTKDPVLTLELDEPEDEGDDGDVEDEDEEAVLDEPEPVKD